MQQLLTDISELLRYDKNSGEFYWIKSLLYLNDKNIGKLAGTISDTGYRIIRIRNKNYRAHRLVWFMETGKMPDQAIDHINRIKLDNRFINLRLCTHSQNMYNRPKTKKPTSSKYKGVYLTPWGWVARIQKNGKQVYQEYFKKEKEAAEAYKRMIKHFSDGFDCVEDV